MPDSMGYMDSLKVLAMTGNHLSSLPALITRLGPLRIFDSGSNSLCDVDRSIAAWLDIQEPPWRSRQICSESVVRAGDHARSLGLQNSRYFIGGPFDYGHFDRSIGRTTYLNGRLAPQMGMTASRPSVGLRVICR